MSNGMSIVDALVSDTRVPRSTVHMWGVWSCTSPDQHWHRCVYKYILYLCAFDDSVPRHLRVRNQSKNKHGDACVTPYISGPARPQSWTETTTASLMSDYVRWHKHSVFLEEKSNRVLAWDEISRSSVRTSCQLYLSSDNFTFRVQYLLFQTHFIRLLVCFCVSSVLPETLCGLLVKSTLSLNVTWHVSSSEIASDESLDLQIKHPLKWLVWGAIRCS